MQLPIRTINANKKIVVTRRLPVPGEIVVQRGQKVTALQKIGRAELTRRYHVIDVARQLAQPHVEMDQVLLKAEGEYVEANEAVASSQGGLPFLRRVARSPLAGRIAAIGQGWVLLETERTIIELQAFVNGVIAKIIPDRGAIIESNGAMIAATCGFGGEAYGPLRRLVSAPFEMLQAKAMGEKVKNSIILGGRTVNESLLRAAEAAQVRGIVVGSIDVSLLSLDPPAKVRVVATEGFGDLSMSPFTFGLLGTLDGKEVSIRGNTLPPFATFDGGTSEDPPLILASSSRNLNPPAEPPEAQRGAARVGSRVRVTCGPLLGASGAIDSIPEKMESTAGGVVAPGAYVKIHGTLYYIPLANLELVV
jgi:hypothetical protein